ncbi:fibronectin type III-like domain-contianing protein [Telluria sp. Tellsp104]
MVTNSGKRAGVETGQVYVSLPADVRSAPRQLAGWTQVSLAPGESRTVTVQLEPLAISALDAKARPWRQPSGLHEVFVGGSSRDIPLSGAFDIR